MRLEFDCQPKIDLMALHAAIQAINVVGFSGVSYSSGKVYIELPIRDNITDAELSALQSIVTAQSLVKSWDHIRDMRVSLFNEVDWRISRAEDTGGRQEELRAYRQALRDITKQGDPSSVAWPTKPW